jgi:hypothetical protein
MRKTYFCSFFFLLGFLLNVNVSAQLDYSIYRNLKVEESALYQNGNIYQKDFLLFIDMLQTTHPAFAPPAITPFNVDSIKRTGYKWAETCSDENLFSAYITSIIALLQDGHTYCASYSIPNAQYYFFDILIDASMVYLAVIDTQYREQAGKKITHLNHYPVWDVINSFKECANSDNHIRWLFEVHVFLQRFWLWETNPYKQSDSSLIITFEDGKEIVLFPENITADYKNKFAIMPVKEAKYSLTECEGKPYFYTILEDQNICYLQFNTCLDQSSFRYLKFISGDKITKEEEKKLKTMPRFDTLAANMFAEIRAKNIQTLIVDVRHNQGGNSRLGAILLSYLKPVNEMKERKTYTRLSELYKDNRSADYEKAVKNIARNNQTIEIGKLYSSDLTDTKKESSKEKKMAKWFKYNKKEKHLFRGNTVFIQSKKTYSSAGLMIIEAMDNNIGQIIGEKSSYKPCTFGDVLSWELPNTKIRGGISHKIFNRPDENKCDEESLTPHILIEQHFDDLQNGEDRCWEWILNHFTK